MVSEIISSQGYSFQLKYVMKNMFEVQAILARKCTEITVLSYKLCLL